MYSLIIIGITITALFSIFFKPGLYDGLKWMIICFFLGFRTIKITSGFLIHPVDIIILALFVKAINLPNRTSQSTYPIWLIFLLPFSFIALLNGLYHSYNSVAVWFEFKNFFLIFPLFYVLDKFLKRDEDLLNLIWIYILTISAIAFFAAIEFFFPFARNLLPGFYSLDVEASGIKPDGFERASFSFWGSMVVGHIMVVALPFLLLIPRTKKLFGSWNNLILVLLSLNLIAIYISGNRADWIILIVMIAIYFLIFLRGKLKFSKILLIVGGGFIVGFFLFQNLGQSFFIRFQSGIAALFEVKSKFDAIDSSGYIRWQRLLNAIDIIMENPFGIGWSRAGWVHSDFVQIIANVGWIPGGMYFTAFLLLSIKLYQYKAYPRLSLLERDIIIVLFMSMIAIGFMFTVNNNYVLTQTGVPLFFIWALSHVYSKKLQRNLSSRKNE